MKSAKFLISLSICLMAGLPARADWPVGLWQSAPDRAGLVVHVRTKPCGQGICGRIERAKDRFGYDKPSSMVGRRMLLNMQQQPDGSYLGRVWEPQENRLMTARMQVTGNVMQLQNCDGDACREVVWKRLR